MQVFAHAHVAVLVIIDAPAQVLEALVTLRIALGLLCRDQLLTAHVRQKHCQRACP